MVGSGCARTRVHIRVISVSGAGLGLRVGRTSRILGKRGGGGGSAPEGPARAGGKLCPSPPARIIVGARGSGGASR